jgi:hypothetical protein
MLNTVKPHPDHPGQRCQEGECQRDAEQITRDSLASRMCCSWSQRVVGPHLSARLFLGNGPGWATKTIVSLCSTGAIVHSASSSEATSARALPFAVLAKREGPALTLGLGAGFCTAYRMCVSAHKSLQDAYCNGGMAGENGMLLKILACKVYVRTLLNLLRSLHTIVWSWAVSRRCIQWL